MDCQSLRCGTGLVRRMHRIRCRECRAAARPDAVLRRGMQRLRAEAPPEGGLEAALAAFGVAPAIRPVQSRRRRSELRGRLLPAGSLTAVSALGAVCWLSYIDADPQVRVPMPRLPSPNAYNLLRTAAAAIPASERRSGPPVGTAEAAEYTDVLRNAIDLHHGVVMSANIADGPRTPPVLGAPDYAYTLKDKRELLARYAPAIYLTRHALPLEYQVLTRDALRLNYDAPAVGAFDDQTYRSDYIQLANALMLDAQVKEASGDTWAAAQSMMDSIELGVLVSHGGTEDLVTGLSCAAAGRVRLWDMVDRLDAAHARAAALRLNEIAARKPAFAEIVVEDKWRLAADLQAHMRRPEWRRTILVPGWSAERSSTVGLASYLYLAPYSKRAILDDITRNMDRLATLSQLPYSDAVPRRLASVPLDGPAQGDPVAAMLVPYFGASYFRDIAASRTELVLLETAFALRAYRLEHHALPDRLDRLVPRYLPAVPEDPFRPGHPLGYRNRVIAARIGGGTERLFPVLYSVGPDGIDDGGSPIDAKSAPGKPSPWYHATSGDLPSPSDKWHSGPMQVRQSWIDESEAKQRLTVRPGSRGDVVAGINVDATP
ncbi:MAG TPA: hypothetical protein VKT77_10070 [Chthonomonadaceae bacterium]|nr:hypothetical protein [Chthonomonadaceae bacterium]